MKNPIILLALAAGAYFLFSKKVSGDQVQENAVASGQDVTSNGGGEVSTNVPEAGLVESIYTTGQEYLDQVTGEWHPQLFN